MQHKQKILNKENNWNELKNYKPNDVVSDDGKLWQNVSGINTKPNNLSTDWVDITIGVEGSTDKTDIVEKGNYKPVESNAVFNYTIKKVNTISDLRETSGDEEGQIITLLGYYEKGDKELLNYKWTNTQGVDDGGSVINSSNGSWIALFNNSVNVLDFGAEDNLENQKVPFQKAVDYLSNIGGGILNIPSKEFRLSHLDFLGKKYSNISINGNNCTIIQFNEKEKEVLPGYGLPTFARFNAADGIFLFDAQVSAQENDNNSIKNIKISGINFVSDVVIDKFDEIYHQICMHGVSNAIIKECSFNGFLGDGIAICRGIDNDGFRNAYNKNIKVLNCNFDGINKDNRQGVSFYYCDGFKVDFCDFKNICRADMIGAIDVEADDSLTKSQRGVITNNKFYNIGGMGAIVIFQRTFTASTITHNGYIISNNDIEDIHSPLTVLGNAEYLNYDGNYGVVFENNRVENSEVVTDLRSAYGVMYFNNYFKNIKNTTLTLVRDVGANNILFEKNSFEDIKSPSGLSFIGNCKNINIISNLFNKMSNRCILVLNASGISNISNNTFKNSTSSNPITLEVKTNTTALDLEYSIIENNRYIGNIPKINLYFYIIGNLIPTTSNLKPKHVLYGNSSVVISGDMPTDMLGDGAGYVKLYREKGNPSNYYPSVYMELFPVGNNGGKTWRRQALNNTFEEWSEWREI